jgi:sugar-specific transcriptional regulator TrmB
LGLTSIQARVYLALARLGPLKILEISKQSKVSRTDVYRTLTRLHELSLVEQMIEVPTRYRAVPVGEGIRSLLNSKTQHYEKLKKDSEDLLNAFNFAEAERRELTSEDNVFVLVPRREAVMKRQIQAIEETTRSIDLVLSWNRFYHGLEAYDRYVKKVADKGVYVRYLVEEPPRKEMRDQALPPNNGGNFEIRFTKEKPKAIFAIYDQRKMMLVTDPSHDAPGESSSLWTNNPSLLALLQEIFDVLWKRAKN